jgi:hypothetical protein
MTSRSPTKPQNVLQRFYVLSSYLVLNNGIKSFHVPAKYLSSSGHSILHSTIVQNMNIMISMDPTMTSRSPTKPQNVLQSLYVLPHTYS